MGTTEPEDEAKGSLKTGWRDGGVEDAVEMLDSEVDDAEAVVSALSSILTYQP